MTEPRRKALKVESYLQKYLEAEDKYEELGAILKGEGDPLVRNYFKYRLRLSRPGHIAPADLERFPPLKALKFVHDCISTSEKTFEASMIRAMAVAGRTAEEIAAEFGTAPINISVFLELFFDVERSLPFDALLQRVVSRAQGQASGNDVAPQEALWLRLAYRSGWDVLQSVMFGRPLADPAQVIQQLDGQMAGQLAIRAREFTETRMISSEASTASDFRSYMEHKRLATLKVKADKAGVANPNQSNFAKAFATLVKEKIEEIPRQRQRDPRWLAAIERDEAEARSWQSQIVYWTDHPEDAAEQESATAERAKVLEGKAIERQELSDRLAREYPLPPQVETRESRPVDAPVPPRVYTRPAHWRKSQPAKSGPDLSPMMPKG